MAEETKSVEQYLEDLEKGIETFNAKFEPVNVQFKTMQERIDGLETKLNTPEAGIVAPNSEKDIINEWDKKYVRFIKSGQTYDQDYYIDKMKDFEPEYVKTISSLMLTTGGYFMPPTRSAKIIEAILALSPFRQLASVETLTVGDTLEMISEVGSVLAAWTSEEGTKTELGPQTWNLQKIPTHPMYSLVFITRKMAQQASFDIEGWHQRKIAEYMASLEGTAFMTGSGVGQPEGLVTRGAVHVAANTAARHEHSGGATSIPDLDGLIAMQDKLNEKFQANACWLMHRTTKSVLRRLTDGMGRYVLEENVTLGAPDRLFGKPIYYMPDMATVTTPPSTFTATNIPIIYGDMRAGYQIVDVPGMVSIRDEYTHKTSNLIDLFVERLGIGGQVVDDNAFVVMTVSA